MESKFQADYQDQMEIVRRYNVGFVLIDKKHIPEWLRITDSLQLFSHNLLQASNLPRCDYSDSAENQPIDQEQDMCL
ncbi:TPA: hypothetical protein EYO57_08150 [Candidatus Poribacteria bacterium]|nr:hypothetical protein [Candidatus Poribacteria bacterium]